MKKIIAFFTALTLTLSMSTPALAVDNKDMSNADVYESIIDGASGEQYVFRSIDLENGDVQFVLVCGEEIIESTYVDKSSRTITTEQFGEKFVMNIAECAEVGKIEIPATTLATYSSVGTIKYRYGIEGFCGLKLSMRTETKANSSYDVCGTYRGLTQFAGMLVTLFAWPCAVASQVAQCILYALGINGSLASFEIPSFIVKASETTNYWKIVDVDNINHYKELYGTKYVATNTTHGSGTYYGGTCDYFTRSDFTQKNTLLATQFYDEMFAFYPWEVYSWR